MKIGRRGKDLAVRIPSATINHLNLRVGDELDYKIERRDEKSIAVLTVVRRQAGRLNPD